MDDVRWFAPNDYTRLIVPDLNRVEFFSPLDDAGLVAAIRRAEEAQARPGPFPSITIEAAGARFFEALMPLLDSRGRGGL